MGTIYKLLDSESFVNYYGGLFTKSNVFKMPSGLVNVLLILLPFAELVIAISLVFNKTRIIGLYGYLFYIMSMMIGEYFMDNFHNLNGTLDICSLA